jgi:hypothetical protein
MITTCPACFTLYETTAEEADDPSRRCAKCMPTHECQFCDWEGDPMAALTHRKATGHLIRLVADRLEREK